jgi:foldase protein PrsA
MLHRSRKSAWRRSVLLIVAALLVMTFMAACGAEKTEKEAEQGTEIATYKGGNVTDTEFDKYLAVFTIMQPNYAQIVEIPQFKEQLLQQYISYKILGSQASDDSMKKAKKDVKAQMEQFEEALKSNADLKASFDEKKLKNKDMEDYLLLTSTVVAHMNSKVTEEEMKTEYQTNGADYATVTVRHILVATTTTDQTTQEQKELRPLEEALKRAKEAKAKLEAGGDWTAIAKEYSDDPGSKETGGLYADKKAGEWVEAFKQAAYKQEVGVIGDPVETEYGYHVILVEKRDTPTYDKLSETDKEAIKSAVAYTHMNKFMTDEMPKQEIVIKLPKTEEEAPAGDAPAAGETPATETPATEAPAAK